MRMPSFTAELSLYDTSERYRHATDRATRSTRRAVIPQSTVIYFSDDGCIAFEAHYSDVDGELVAFDFYTLPC